MTYIKLFKYSMALGATLLFATGCTKGDADKDNKSRDEVAATLKDTNSYGGKQDSGLVVVDRRSAEQSYPGSILVGKEGVLPVGTDYSKRPVLNIYFDPICPGCTFFERELGDYLKTKMDEGDLVIRYIPLMFLNEQSTDGYSGRASAYLLGVAEHAPELFLDFLNAIFAEGFAPEEGSAYVPVPNEQFDAILTELGATAEVIEKVSSGTKANIELAYSTTMKVLASNNVRKASPSGQVSTPYVIPYSSGKDSGTSISMGLDMVESTKKAVEDLLSK